MNKLLWIRFVLAAVTISIVSLLVLMEGPTVSAQSGVIRGCVGVGGQLSIIGPANSCGVGESALIWNAVGPIGPSGGIGPTGPQGPAGPAGPAGRDGRDSQGPAAPSALVELRMTISGLNGNNPTPIQQFSLGATNPGGTLGGGGTPPPVVFKDLIVTKMLDGLSLPLLTAASKGTVLPELDITVFEIGKSAPFAIYEFTNVTVTADLLGSSVTALNEQVSFNYETIKSDIIVNGTLFHSCYELKQARSC